MSVGLIPETDLIKGVEINSKTNSAIVNEYRETTMKNVFACGNVLHVHDLVDYVTKESQLVGKYSALNAICGLNRKKECKINSGLGVRYTIPNTYFEGKGNLEILFRVNKKFVKSKVEVLDEKGNVVFSKFILSASAGEMQSIEVDKSKICGNITINMNEG